MGFRDEGWVGRKERRREGEGWNKYPLESVEQ